MTTLKISKKEYVQRIKKIQESMALQKIDVLIAHACECESANVRYLSNFWAVFDFAGVLIPIKGDPILLTGGPESYDFAVQFSQIDDIRVHPLYVETSAPEWDKPTDAFSFKKLFEEVGKKIAIKKIGLANSNIMPYKLVRDIEKAAPGAEVVEAEDLIMKARWYKSDDEIAILKEAYRITEESVKNIFDMIRPGVSEWELEALWRSSAYRMGAEGTSYPIWVTSGDKTYQSLCRSTNRIIGKNEMVQLTFGAKYQGYCGNYCRPVIIGKLPEKHEKMIKVALECLNETFIAMKPGVSFAEVYNKFQAKLEKYGFSGSNLYGPAHGTGMQECEGPWVDNRSDMVFAPNMAFNVDIWIADGKYGVRYEDGVVIREKGIEILTNYKREIINI